MGSEQSALLNGDNFVSSFSVDAPLDIGNPASAPSSPKRGSRSDKSANLFKEITRSLSLSVNTSSHLRSSGIPSVQSAMETHSKAETSHNLIKSSAPTRSSSVSACTNRGIVIVCPGPSQRLRSAASLDTLTRYTKQDSAEMQLKKLRQIPAFTPIRRSSSTLSPSPSDTSVLSTEKCYRPSLTSLDPSKLRSLVEEFQKCIQHRVEDVLQKQTHMIGLQNKIDYEVKRSLVNLKARDKGVVPSPLRQSRQSVSSPNAYPTNHPVKLAGRQQMDAVVLQTSQVSGLIDQCTIVIENLRFALDQLNQSLPESKRLEPLNISLPKR